MFRRLRLVFLSLIYSVFFGSYHAVAYEYKIEGGAGCYWTSTGQIMPLNSAYQVFDNVDQVMVFLDTDNDLDFEIPDSLKPEYLSDMLSALYASRYKARLDAQGNKFSERNDRGCYGRNGQPVSVVSFEELERTGKENSLKEGTLTVYVQIRYPSSEVVSIKVVHYRPHLKQSWWRSLLGMPTKFWNEEGRTHEFNFKQTGDEEKNERLDYRIEGYFLGRIY